VRDHEAKKCVGSSLSLPPFASRSGAKGADAPNCLARRKRKRAAKQHVAIEDHGNDA